VVKNLLSISIVFSSLFAGVCTSNVAHGYGFDEAESLGHTHEIECEHCEELNEQEVDCCNTHLENAKQAAIVKPVETKISDNLVVKAFQPKPVAKIPEYKKQYEYRTNENKAPPHLQISLPRLE
jgi:hypothetical protein